MQGQSRTQRVPSGKAFLANSKFKYGEKFAEFEVIKLLLS